MSVITLQPPPTKVGYAKPPNGNNWGCLWIVIILAGLLTAMYLN